jgi:two-component system, NarL family, sensor histidine kinase DesK
MTSTTETTCRRAPLWAWAGTIFGLLWLGPLVANFAGSDPSGVQIALVAVGLPAFAYLFVTGVMGPPQELLPRLAGMVAIAVVLTLAALDSWAFLFVWAASAAAAQLSERANVLALLGITAIAAGTLALTDPDGAVFWAITGTVFGTGTLWLLIGGLVRTNRELREARAELAELAVAEERLRFARDLHDLLGHDLSLIALKAELAGRLLPERVGEASTEVDEIKTLTRDALARVREAVSGYRRPTLAGELAGARAALEAAGIELTIEHPSVALDPDSESVLAWTVREGATNVLRHSGARHAAIAVRPGPAGTEVEISDDGRGETAAGDAGHGLAGLRERALSIGGELEVGAAAEGGFRLRVSVPDGRVESPA